MSSDFSLAGSTILVTGSTRGIGWAIAQGMARAGGHVVLNGRDPAQVAQRQAALEAEGLLASTAPFDVTDEPAAGAALRDIADRHGSLDVLVNNAGVQHRAPFTEFATDDYRRVIETNQTAGFVLAREAAKLMLPHGRGRIINVGSIMSQIARPTVTAYIMSKGAIAAMTYALAVELGPQEITCNAIAPGYVATDLNEALWTNPDFNAFVEARTPLRRWARPEEIAGAAVFLASPAGSYVNGQVLRVDGGMTINA